MDRTCTWEIGSIFHQLKLSSEIDKFLPEGFRSLSSSDRDTAFKLAFNDMALSFMSTEDRENPKKKTPENSAYTTLYTKFYLPNKRRRESTITT
jgi:hypothetical protein